MAKKKTAKHASKPPRPAELRMDLFEPGMTVLHRAGLGGLACTLKYIERAYRAGALLDDEVPGGPWADDHAPWEFDDRSVTLHFGCPDGAAEYLKRLFAVGFDIKDGLIYLPGQYEQEPSLAVRAELQAGLLLTFLQHGRVRQLENNGSQIQIDPTGDGLAQLTVEYKRCNSFKHQEGWKEFIDTRGQLHCRPLEVIGPLNPGAVVRHVAFTGATKIVNEPKLLLPLYFALVGCQALRVNRGVGILIVPDVIDLEAFLWDRPAMTPQTMRDCRIAGASDAALQTHVRIRSRSLLLACRSPAVYAMELRPTTWASQQKSRVSTVETSAVPRFESCEREEAEQRLDIFEVALAELPPRLGTSRKTEAKHEAFWSDSVVRPFVADNLAQGRPWYRAFSVLMTRLDPANKTPVRNRIAFEKEGLRAMIEKIPWKDAGEQTVVRAVHEALRRRFGQIAADNKGKSAAMKNRWRSEYDRWRLAFAGSKTADQMRRTLCDLFSRAGVNPVLQADWETLLPMLDDSNWEKTRDLALLGLASYSGRGADAVEPPNDANEESLDERNEG